MNRIKQTKKNIKSLIGYNNVLRFKKIFNRFKPSELILNVSASCNAKCPFCARLFMGDCRTNGFMDLSIAKKAIREAKKLDIKRLRLYAYSEPTLYPNLGDLIAYAKEKQFYVSISTNASNLHKWHNELLKVDRLQFSIEGWDKRSYDKYRYPLKFENIWNNISDFKNMKGNKMPLTTANLLITNHTDISKFFKTWANIIDNIFITAMLPSSFYSKDTKRIASDVNPDIKDELLNYGVNMNKFCFYPFSTINVDYDGKIALCCINFTAEHNFGHIDDGLMKVFKNSKIEMIRNEFIKKKCIFCKDCNFFKEPIASDTASIVRKLMNADISDYNYTIDDRVFKKC